MNLQAGTRVLVEAVVDGEIDGDAVPVELTTWRGDTMRQWFKDSTIHPFPGVQEWRPIESAPKDGRTIILANPAFFKRGTYIQRRVLNTPFTTEELASLPPLHNARKNPNLVIERSEYRILDLPPIRKIANREAVLFDGHEPQCEAEQAASASDET